MNAKEIALKAFDLQDYIAGTESGGIDPPRIITGVRCLDDKRVEIDYTYPETCGLSDVHYHCTGYGQTFTESYLVDNGKFRVLRDGKWEAEVFKTLWCKEKVESFYQETELAA